MVTAAGGGQVAGWDTITSLPAVEAEALALLPLLRRAPRHFDRVATIVERGDGAGLARTLRAPP